MELGYDGVLLNSAVALAQEPIKMAKALGMQLRLEGLDLRLELCRKEIWQVHQLQR